MFVKKKYLLRHSILNSLQKKLSNYDGQEHFDFSKIEMKISDLANDISCSDKEVLEQIDYLDEIKEITCNWKQGVQNFAIIKLGTIAFFDKKHLDEGRKEFWNDAYDVIKTISAILLLIIAVITFIINIIDTRQNKTDIEKLKTEIKQLKDTTHK